MNRISDLNVIALVKGNERYTFTFPDSAADETLRTLGRFASDSEMSFEWADAAVLAIKIKGMLAK